jgi:hypothetical protein
MKSLTDISFKTRRKASSKLNAVSLRDGKCLNNVVLINDSAGQKHRNLHGRPDFRKNVSGQAISTKMAAGFAAFDHHGRCAKFFCKSGHTIARHDRNNRNVIISPNIKDITRKSGTGNKRIYTRFGSSFHDNAKLRGRNHGVNSDNAAIGNTSGNCDFGAYIIEFHAGASYQSDTTLSGDRTGQLACRNSDGHSTLY